MALNRLSAATHGRTVLAAAAFAALLGGCASNTPPKDETAGWSPNKLYAEAMDERNSGNFEKAVKLFEKLEGRAAGTPLAQQAELEKAYAHYKAGEQAQAIDDGLLAVRGRQGAKRCTGVVSQRRNALRIDLLR